MKKVELHKIFLIKYLISGIPIWKLIHKSGYIFLNFEVIYIYHSTLLFSLKNGFYDAVSWRQSCGLERVMIEFNVSLNLTSPVLLRSGST